MGVKEQGPSADNGAGTFSGTMRRYRVIIIVIAVCTALLLVYFQGVLFEEETVKIGVIAPITGSSAHLADVIDGLNMAADRLNRWGGINGALVEIIVRDSGSDPNVSVELFEDLERTEHPLLYISAACSCTRPLIPLAEESQVPLIGIATANAVGFEETDWSFRYYPGTEKEIAPVMSVMEEEGIATLGIMRSDNILGTELTEYLSGVFEDAGGSVEIVDYCCKDTDIPAKVQSIADNDAIYIAGDFKATQAAVIAIDETGYSGYTFASSSASTPGMTTMPEAEGLYVSAPPIYNPNYLPGRTVIEEFVEEYGHNMTHYAASGYDVMNLIYGLMMNKDLTRQEVRDQLHGGFSFPSILGPLKVAPGSHDIQYELFPAQVVEGALWFL